MALLFSAYSTSQHQLQPQEKTLSSHWSHSLATRYSQAPSLCTKILILIALEQQKVQLHEQ